LGRIIDRLRFLQRYIDITEGEDKSVMLMNRRQSIFRMRLMYISIFFCTLAGLMVCMVVAALFIGGINQFSLNTFISVLFVACMICLIISFILLSFEIFLATKTTRRNLIKTETIVSKYKLQ
jgi:predicted membrane protein